MDWDQNAETFEKANVFVAETNRLRFEATIRRLNHFLFPFSSSIVCVCGDLTGGGPHRSHDENFQKKNICPSAGEELQ